MKWWEFRPEFLPFTLVEYVSSFSAVGSISLTLGPGAPGELHQHEWKEEEKVNTRAQKKAARKKQKKKERKAAEVAFEIEELTEGVEHTSISEISTPYTLSSSIEATPTDEHENLRRVRALRKKLKQIEQLEARLASGDIASPDHDQVVKIARKQELCDEIQRLTNSQS